MVVQDILQYLMAHPDAKDTLQGIFRWWLPGNWIERESREVQDALEVLVARGWLTQRQVTSSQIVYGLNKERMGAIQDFLRELGGTTEKPGQ